MGERANVRRVLGSLLLVATAARAPAAPHWSRTFETSATNENASDVLVTRDGDFVVAGICQCFGSNGWWVTRLDASGEPIWEIAGGTTSPDIAEAVAELADGRLAFVGSAENYLAGAVVALEPTGATSWMQRFQLPDPSFPLDDFSDLAPTAGGGLVMVGSPRNSGAAGSLRELGPDGAVLRSVQPSEGTLGAIVPSRSGGWLAVGSRIPADTGPYTHGLVVRLDDQLAATWSVRIASTILSSLHGAIERDDDGWIAVGLANRLGLIVGLSATGELEWQLAFDAATPTNAMYLVDLDRAADGTFVAVGVTPDYDGALVRFTASGELLSQHRLGWSQVDGLSAVAALEDGDLVLAGRTSTPAGRPVAWVLRTAPDGSACAGCGYHREGGFAVTTDAVTSTPRAVTMQAMPPGTSVPSWTLQPMATTDVTQCFHPAGGAPPEVSGPLDAEPLRVHAGGRLTWAPSIGCDCDAFDLHRGDVVGLAARQPASCLQAHLDMNTAIDAATPGVGNAWYYLVTCVAGGTNGTAGNDSLGVPRDAPPCP